MGRLGCAISSVERSEKLKDKHVYLNTIICVNLFMPFCDIYVIYIYIYAFRKYT